MATSVGRLMGSLLALVSLVLMAAPVAHADGPLTYLKSVPLAAMAHDILVEGHLAYVATATGLTILDVADPANPTVRGSALAPDECQGLAKKGSYIYLAAATGGMQVIDVSNPDAPQTVANAKAGWQGGNIWDVAVHPTANAAYAASFDGELYVWDITNPAAPRLTQTLGVLGWRYDSLKFEAYMRNLGKSGTPGRHRGLGGRAGRSRLRRGLELWAPLRLEGHAGPAPPHLRPYPPHAGHDAGRGRRLPRVGLHALHLRQALGALHVSVSL